MLTWEEEKKSLKNETKLTHFQNGKFIYFLHLFSTHQERINSVLILDLEYRSNITSVFFSYTCFLFNIQFLFTSYTIAGF